jgi:hypothetical protein
VSLAVSIATRGLACNRIATGYPVRGYVCPLRAALAPTKGVFRAELIERLAFAAALLETARVSARLAETSSRAGELERSSDMTAVIEEQGKLRGTLKC